MTFEEAIAAFRQGEFTLDVPKLLLRRCGGDGSDQMVGPGTIQQDAQGRIHVKCHAVFGDVQSIADLLNRRMRSESGSLFADEDYFELQATDQNAEVWDGGRTLTDESMSFPMMAGTITARPRKLQRIQDRGKGKPSFQIYLFDQDRRDWEALIGGPFEITLGAFSFGLTIEADRDEQIKVTAASEQTFPDAFERRFVEGLQFVVGQSLHCSIVDETTVSSRTLNLYGAASRHRRVHPYPPLQTHTTQFKGEVVKLLGFYLTYLASLPDEGIWSPPTSFLSLLRGASESSLDGWLIGLCVAVEGLAGLIDYEAAEISEDLAKVRAGVLNWMVAEGVSEGNRKRIEGLLGNLGTVRPRDRMMNLVPSGALREDDITAWTKARNRAVHTRKANKDDLEREKLQNSLDGLHRIYRLLYSITFHLISYEGLYTDYAEIGFPVRSYPATGRKKE